MTTLANRSVVSSSVLGRITIVLLIGVVGWAVHHGPAALATPPSCPDALDVAAALAARLAPRAVLGAWVLQANALLLVAALAVIVALLRVACGTWLIAVPAGLAVALLPVFDPRLSPFDPAALIVAAATFALLAGARRSHDLTRGARASRLWVGVLLSAMIMPRAMLPLAALAAAWTLATAPPGRLGRRWATALAAAVAVVGGVLGLSALTPGLPPGAGAPSGASCLLPSLPMTTESFAGLQAVVASAGPFGVALAALGAFSLGHRLKRGTWPLVAYAVLPLVGTASPADGVIRGFAPTLVAFWVVMAVGLKETACACLSRRGGRVAAALLVLLLPLLQLPGLLARDQPAATFGQERLSLQAFHRLLAVLPDNSVLVMEDALTTVLLRALDGTWQKMGKTLRLVDSRVGAVSAVVDDSRSHVFALPRGQAELQFLGFELTDVDRGGVSGLAEVTRGGVCQFVPQRWVDLPGLRQSSALSVVVRQAGEGANLILYASSDVAPAPASLVWSPGDVFDYRVYARAQAGDRVRLDADSRDDGLPADEIGTVAAFVARLEFWRPPTAAGVLAVTLGIRDSTVVGRASAVATHGVLVCPAFPHALRGLGVPQ